MCIFLLTVLAQKPVESAKSIHCGWINTVFGIILIKQLSQKLNLASAFDWFKKKILQKSLTAFFGGRKAHGVSNKCFSWSRRCWVPIRARSWRVFPTSSHRKSLNFGLIFSLAIRLFEICYENPYRVEFTERLSDAFLESSNSTIWMSVIVNHKNLRRFRWLEHALAVGAFFWHISAGMRKIRCIAPIISKLRKAHLTHL